MKYGQNIGKAPIKVYHSDLKRDSDSLYRSKCPSCPKGILLVQRNQKTLDLEATDCCIACGQIFIYQDIRTLRRRDRGSTPERN